MLDVLAGMLITGGVLIALLFNAIIGLLMLACGLLAIIAGSLLDRRSS